MTNPPAPSQTQNDDSAGDEKSARSLQTTQNAARTNAASLGAKGSFGRTFSMVLAAVVLGTVVGLLIPQEGIRPIVVNWLNHDDQDQEEESDGHEEGSTFEVSHAAQKTYGVEIGKVDPGSFTQYINVPAFVRERPAVSNLQASTRLQGVVTRIFVQVGQSVREGDPLVELELTGNELAGAQALLLDSVQQLRIVEDEIARLRPAAEDGGIARKSLIEKQYDERRIKSRVESTRQELLVRGLSSSDVDGIIKDGQLVRTMTLFVPTGIRPGSNETPHSSDDSPETSHRVVSQSFDKDEWVYSVEDLHVSPGSVVVAGESLCDIAYHETLLIEGQAYERDLPLLTELVSSQRTVSVSVGDSDSPEVIDDLKILFVDNHVDNQTQTYRFYIEISNTAYPEPDANAERRFRNWQFKPGQRGHVRLPAKIWNERIILPADAVAQDGVDFILFRRTADHDHFHGDIPPHSEFQKLVVSVDYKDQHSVVIDGGRKWKPWFEVALNNADMLLRASMEGGGGGHDHHGHEH